MDIENSKPWAWKYIQSQNRRMEKSGPGPWRAYIYCDDGFHTGGKWFHAGAMKYPDEEITKEEAYQNSVAAITLGREVRVCDGGYHLVFHAKDGVSSTAKDFGETRF